MSPWRLLLLLGLLPASGCLWPVRDNTDQAVRELAARPFDLASYTANATTDARTADLMRDDRPPDLPPAAPRKLELTVPRELPGSEAPPIPGFKDLTPVARERLIRRLFPELPPLPPEPRALPGPDGHSYTLADLQRLAAANSPTLHQAADAVQVARGNLIQAGTYPNPTLALTAMPSNNNDAAGAWGGFFDQVIKTGGKLKLQAAVAQKDLDNAMLALKRARSDLATQVRTAYYGFLVARETMRVTRALAQFTDEIYRLQTGLLQGGQVAPYEPMALRSQAYTARLAYKQSIPGYVYAWKQLVAAVGLHQLPLSEVEGRVDQLIPLFEYDKVLAHVLRNHTDILTARNGLDRQRYNLKLAQIAPLTDVEVVANPLKEFVDRPFTYFHAATASGLLPIWDQNRGNIMLAQAALLRALEEPHRVELALTTTLATAYTGYKQNLDALEYYRRHILPDQVRTFRGVFTRRQIDLTASFGDLVTAQQTLTTDVTNYLGVLGSLWTSVVSVADLLQTDDFFQLGKPLEVPELPNLDQPVPWPCGHPHAMPAPVTSPSTAPAATMPDADQSDLPFPRRVETPASPEADHREQPPAGKQPPGSLPYLVPDEVVDEAPKRALYRRWPTSLLEMIRI